MPSAEKVELVAELRARIEGSEALLLTEFRGLTVSEITELRRSLAEGGTTLAVVKNTLMRRAADDAGVTELTSLLEGPSAVAFVQGDPVAAAKSVVDAGKRFPALVLKGGYLDGNLLSAAEAKALASLESREAMLSTFAGMVKSEMAKAAAVFASAQSKFLSVLDAYRGTLPAEAPEAPDEGSAEAAPDAAPEEAEEAPPEAPSEATEAASEEATSEGSEEGDA